MNAILQLLDQLILDARLEDIRLIASMSVENRHQRLAASLGKLGPGQYLFGCGPYNVGLIRLGQHEISLGRHASPIEESSTSPLDYEVNDAIYLSPREVSRSHATIRVDEHGEVWVVDESSTTGTWVDGVAVESGEPGVRVSSGSVIRLGPSGINTYVFLLIEADSE